MDEPTASIDALSAQLIKDAVLRARRDWGTTLIVASHDGNGSTVLRHGLSPAEGPLLGTGRENVLFGPWEPMGNGLWGKSLGDGQQLLVPRPPEALAAAVIENVTIMPQGRACLIAVGRSHCPA